MQQTIAPSVIFNAITLIIALPILAFFAWNLWMSYIQTIFLDSIKWTLLEIKPPKEVFKSPLAMELVLNSLYQAGGHGNWYQKYWQGRVRNYFSLEIVSIEGAVHFYIRTPIAFKNIIESQIYAQYPQAEVTEVTDYAASVPDFSPEASIQLFSANITLSGKEEVYPIKTYVEWGLDRAVGSLEENERIDPITPMLEYMGSIGAGEQIWCQIIVRADTKRFVVKNKEGIEEVKSWTDKVKAVIKEFNASLVEKDSEGKVIGSRRATKGEIAVIDAIERNANKLAFDTGIRVVYLTQKDKFDGNRIAGTLGMFRQYGAADYNGFKPEGPTAFDFPWQDLTGARTIKKKKEALAAYKARSYFYGSFHFNKPEKYFTYPEISGKKPFILTTEELATIFHLPGRVAETPSFVRIEATKSEPPANLPV
ncbi:MAG TPA: hypothetical protein VL576_02035 [Candidatus Paceibacterota bacterium]|jgi:hypothetical protein|nr:hypothetical protein [Candidatus Paceibacterota bacterium]